MQLYFKGNFMSDHSQFWRVVFRGWQCACACVCVLMGGRNYKIAHSVAWSNASKTTVAVVSTFLTIAGRQFQYKSLITSRSRGELQGSVYF